MKINLVGLAAIWIVLVLACGGVSPPPKSLPKTPTPTPNPTATPNPTKEQDYRAGYNKGLQEGKKWSKEPGQGMPLQLFFDVVSKDAAKTNGKADNRDWENGWIDGAKQGFAAGRGRAFRNAEDDPNFARLAWDLAEVNVMLFDNNEKHVATIIALDQDSGTMTVRYVNGTVERKEFASVAQFWFVKKS